MAQRVKKPAMEQPIKLVRAQTLYEHNGRVFKNEPYVHNGGNLLHNRDGRRAPDGLCRGRIDMLGTLARQGPTTSNHKHIKKSEFTIKVTRVVNEDYRHKAGIDDEWVYVPDKTARKNKVVQCNEEEIDAEIDEGCVEDLKKKKCAKRTASELEESELATPEGGENKRRG